MLSNHKKCIDKVRKEVMEANPEIKHIRFKLTTIYNGKRSDITGQEIEITEEVTKKDGSKKMKNSKSFVSHTYCPFCGKKF